VTDCHGDDDRSMDAPREMTLRDFQQLIHKMYFEKDVARGVDGTFVWLVEEIGELAAVLRDGSDQQRREEFADVLAWLATIANILDIDLEEAAVEKYGAGCPGCGRFVCCCDDSEKP
jgi:NTP pyrophosphatase (non-canonical NTP hydrolase)